VTWFGRIPAACPAGGCPAALSVASPRAVSAGGIAGRHSRIAPERAAEDLDRLYRLALSLCGSRELAEDLVQEAYVRLMARPRWVRRGGEFAYLARIVRNLLYDHYRRGGRVEWGEMPDDEDWAAGVGGHGDPEAAARTRELYGLIGALPADQREVVAAVDVAGMSYRDAAKTLGVPIGTVMSRLARARKRLADALGPDLE
jgi:RNA polymerase sigma-70 factor (ECF subfamily)